jgi:hypothetical protein
MSFFEQIASFPTVFFTVLVGLAVLYWLFVIIGALDIDLFDSAAHVADGALQGGAHLADAAIEGAVQAADAAIEGAAHTAEGAFEGAAHGVGEAAEGVGAELLHAAEGGALSLWGIRRRKVPITILATIFVLAGWVACYLAMEVAGPTLGAFVPSWLLGTLVMVGSAVVAMPAAHLASRPLAPLFATKEAERRTDLIGQTCTIETGSVDAGFGQAIVEGGEHHKIQVRYDKGGGAFVRGDKALIIDFDREREAFRIERIDVIGEASDERERAAKRGAAARGIKQG